MKRSVLMVLLVWFLITAWGSNAAQAASVSLNLGGDYWLDRGGMFELMLRAQGNVARRIALAGRVGAMVVTSPNEVGIPADLIFQIRLRKAYIEGMAGPWILFEGEPIRAHLAMGFGIRGGPISLGMEIGWLNPHGMVGMRAGFAI